MWSDAAREAAIEARKKNATGHNAGQGNRKVAAHVKAQHAGADHYSVLAGAAKGALVGTILPVGGTLVGAAYGAYNAHSKNVAIAAKKGK